MHGSEGSAFVRIMHKHLPDELRPSYVVRHDGITVIFTDPRSTRVEVVAWMIDNLTVPERNYVRAAVNEPPVGTRLRGRTLRGMSAIPQSINLVDRRQALRPVNIEMPTRSDPSAAVDSAIKAILNEAM